MNNILKYTIGDGEKLSIDIEKSHGPYIVDKISGKKYLDCASQYASLPLGWNNEHLNNELNSNENFLKFCLLNKISNCDFYTEIYSKFIECFSSAATDFNKFFFIEGGTLGVENALKAAFDWKAKQIGLSHEASNDIVKKMDIIHLEEAFHGRSGYCLSITNTIPNKVSLFPKFKWTRVKNPKLKFPIVESEVKVYEELSLLQIERALKTKMVAAIILETIQGEGGDNHFRTEYIKALRELSNNYECLLIFDEVQTGVGLTGRMWAYEHHGVIPDLMSFGKKAQVCGFASTNRILEIENNVFKESSRISSTWGGNLMDMLRFIGIYKVINKLDLVSNAEIVGEYFLEKLKEVNKIKNIRGKGLMIAFDLNTKEERDFYLNKINENMVVLPSGKVSIRMRPNLTFDKQNVNECIDQLKIVFN